MGVHILDLCFCATVESCIEEPMISVVHFVGTDGAYDGTLVLGGSYVAEVRWIREDLFLGSMFLHHC